MLQLLFLSSLIDMLYLGLTFPLVQAGVPMTPAQYLLGLLAHHPLLVLVVRPITKT